MESEGNGDVFFDLLNESHSCQWIYERPIDRNISQTEFRKVKLGGASTFTDKNVPRARKCSNRNLSHIYTSMQSHIVLPSQQLLQFEAAVCVFIITVKPSSQHPDQGRCVNLRNPELL